ncbi:hypothetical protein [Neorhodopirellula lusitana]|uniref:hypothetical protein n=1 Tax=Neorhodopirellula lusitana TaxID=445327 RepID=UPI0024B6F7F0|nr:hypothetical protein [Neorhodopirellula lusitana]
MKNTQGGTRTRKAVFGRGILNHQADVENTGENVDSDGAVSHLCPESFDASELLSIWRSLDEAGRADLLRIASGIASRQASAEGRG